MRTVIIVLLMLSVQGGILSCQANTKVSTDYRFSLNRLDVSASVPLGTVLAVVSVPCGTVNELSGRIRRELWSSGHHVQGMTTMVKTNVKGIGARIVVDTQPLGGDDLGSQFPWSLGGGTYALVRDVIRIELVKTGSVLSGELTQVMPDVQFRRYALVAGKARLVYARSLRYAGDAVKVVSIRNEKTALSQCDRQWCDEPPRMVAEGEPLPV